MDNCGVVLMSTRTCLATITLLAMRLPQCQCQSPASHSKEAGLYALQVLVHRSSL